MTNLLYQLRAFTTVVADTGELPAIKAFKPEDATTNPSLILKAVTLPEYAAILDTVVAQAQHLSADLAVQVEEAADTDCGDWL